MGPFPSSNSVPKQRVRCPMLMAGFASHPRIAGFRSGSAAREGKQPCLPVGVLGNLDTGGEQPGLCQRGRVRRELLVYEVDELRVQRLVYADTAREVPRVHQEV